MKKILIILLGIFMIGNVSAKEVKFYFYKNGATSSTSNVDISSKIVALKTGEYYATYKDTSIIKNINSIKGKKFNLTKNGKKQISGKEWYCIDKNNKKIYFSESKKYKVSDIIKTLGKTNDKHPMINMYANWNSTKNKTSKKTYVYIEYHINGGKLKKTSKKVKVKNSIIYYNNNKNISKIKWNKKLGKNGLENYNNSSKINIEKNGYILEKNLEWNTKKDGTGKSYSQNEKYKASAFCNASKKDCTIILYANWKRSLNSISSCTPNSKVNTQNIEEGKMATTIINGSSSNWPIIGNYKTSNYQGITSDQTKYFYLVENLEENSEEKAVRVNRISVNGDEASYLEYNNSTVLEGIIHGNGIAYMSNGNNTLLGITSKGVMVTFKVSGTTLLDKKTIIFQDENGNRVNATGITFVENINSSAGIYIKTGRKIYYYLIPYNINTKEAQIKIKGTYKFDLQPYAGPQDKVLNQSIAYHNGYLFEFNQYYYTDTYIDAYDVKANCNGNRLVIRDIYKPRQYGFNYREIEGIAWIGDTYYIESMWQKNGKTEAGITKLIGY